MGLGAAGAVSSAREGPRTFAFALPGSPGEGAGLVSTAAWLTTSSSHHRGYSFRSVTSIRRMLRP